MTGVQRRHGDGNAATADRAGRQFAAMSLRFRQEQKDWPVEGGDDPDLDAAQFDKFATAVKP